LVLVAMAMVVVVAMVVVWVVVVVDAIEVVWVETALLSTGDGVGVQAQT
jgi:hypothetical protein